MSSDSETTHTDNNGVAVDINASNLELVPYTTGNNLILNIGFDGIDDFWLTQAQISELYGTSIPNISMHISNVFSEKELEEFLVCKDFLIPKEHGRTKGNMQMHNVKHYNIDMVLAIGYRVKSKEGIAFRKKTTEIIKERVRNQSIITQDQFAQELMKLQNYLENEIIESKKDIVDIIEVAIIKNNKMDKSLKKITDNLEKSNPIPRQRYDETISEYEDRIRGIKSKNENDGDWLDNEGVWHTRNPTI
jgi:hypothetical protein